MLPFVPSNAKTILEVGCGEGFFMQGLKAQQEVEAWGIEPEAVVSEKASVNFKKIICSTVEDAIHQLPDDYFDCIVFNDVLEHLLHPDRVLRSLHGKLRAGGCVVASVPNVRFMPNLYQLIVNKDWKYDPAGGILDETHFRFFTKKSMIRLFSDAGYDLNGISGINEIRSFKYRMLFLFTLGFFEDARYMQFACVASKAL